MTSPRRLGRGLEALLGRVAAHADQSGESPSVAPPEDQAQPAGAQADGTPVPVPDPASEASQSPPQTAPFPTAGPELQAAPPPSDESGPPAEPSGEHASPEAAPPSYNPDTPTAGPIRIDLRQIDSNPFQPRQDFDPAELQALCDSLRAHGLLQPLVARRVEDRFQLIAGERRLQAAAKAGWTQVPVLVVEADDREVAELAIVENLQRKDLNPLEKAASFQRYLQDFGATQEELAARLKLDRSTIANLIRLLELPEAVQDAIRQGKITQGHARALLSLGEEPAQIEFCQRIQREGLSVRQTEAAVQAAVAAADAEPLGLVDRDGTKSRPARPNSEHLAALEQELRAALGMKVKLTHHARGRGKMVVHFRNHEEFDRLRRHICGPARPDAQSHAG